ncbi:MAG: hypothetical protein E7664_00955 [Ruminococcaceae bacterium]|nr:hypothetical protein [Oscillospiraceae bacterium]
MKKVMACILSLVMLLSLCVPMTVTASAAEERTVSYLGDAKADTLWYEKDTDAKEFVLNSAAEFLGFRDLVNLGVTFRGVTVKLGCDIVINEGDASEWSIQTYGLNQWKPIGHSKSGKYTFSGTFDGQGHYISGIYQNSIWDREYDASTFTSDISRGRDGGLFFHCSAATVKNFAIVNSVFINNGYTGTYRATVNISADSQGNASVVTRANDTKVENVWSDADVRGGYATGGIVAYLGGTSTVKNCVYTGTIDLSQAADCAGALVGCDNSATTASVEDCLFAGTMILGKQYYSATKGIGAIVGTNGKIKVERCVNAGTLQAQNGKDVATVGAISYSKNNASATYADSYYVNDFVANAKNEGNASASSIVATNVSAVSRADLTSGNGLNALGNTWTKESGKLPMPKTVKDTFGAILDTDFGKLKPAVPTVDDAQSEETQPFEEETTTVEEGKKGCRSFLASAALITVFGVGLGAAVACRKKED